VTSAAKWSVKRYAAKWPTGQAERMAEECLADLDDTRGVLHILMFVVGLWWRVGKVPAETASTSQTIDDVPSTNKSIIIEVPAATLTVQAPPPTLHVNVGEQIRVSDGWLSSSAMDAANVVLQHYAARQRNAAFYTMTNRSSFDPGVPPNKPQE
jgi:hypothetical protein